jgi:hypothetical protein
MLTPRPEQSNDEQQTNRLHLPAKHRLIESEAGSDVTTQKLTLPTARLKLRHHRKSESLAISLRS